MDFHFTPEDEAFRQEVRQFLATDYPQDLLAKVRAGQVLDRQDYDRSQRAMHSRGWFALAWPEAHGGAGWGAHRRYIFEQEFERAGVPWYQPMGVIYLAPVLYTFGSEAQQRRWLPGILDSTTFWAQGYSEPGSGSDLASLQFRAEREGDHYVLNGTKIWTSYAQWADWIFLLARTSTGARKQDGISFLCADMTSPGISVTPLVSLDGVHHLNRVDFDNVRVPVDNLVGEEGKGWHCANFLLGNERVSYAHVSRKRQDLKAMRDAAATLPLGDGRVLGDDAAFQAQLAAQEMAVAVLDVAVARVLCDPAGVTLPRAAALKIQVTELAQSISELGLAVAGPLAVLAPDRHAADWSAGLDTPQRQAALAMSTYMFDRAQTIFGGTTEVQKGIIWKAIERSGIGPGLGG